MSRAGGGAHRATGRAASLALVAAVALLLLVGTGTALPFRLITVDSGSMAPAIPSGSLVLERTEPASAVSVGQVISYVPPEHDVEVTHRVVWRAWDEQHRLTFRTRGDANPGEDPWQPTVVGDEVWTPVAGVPALGAVLAVARTAATEPVVLAVAAAAVIAVLWLGGRRPDRAQRTTALVVVALIASAGTALSGGGDRAQAAFSTNPSGGHAVSTGTLLTPALDAPVSGCLLARPRVGLTWRSPADQRTAVAVERATVVLGSPTGWTQVATAAADATGWADTGVQGLTVYAYRVRHLAGTWSGAASETRQVTTLSLSCTSP